MTANSPPIAFTPGLESPDLLANYWLRQATLRLRREICWLWQERTGGQGGNTPPLVERVSESLDRARFFEEKQKFYQSDATARYLTRRLEEPEPEGSPQCRGSFSWAVRTLDLDAIGRFALGLGLLGSFDSAAGPVFAACHNDANRTSLTLSLLQKLWDDPARAVALADPGHALFRYGLLRRYDAPNDWDAPMRVADLVARKLLRPDEPPPSQLEALPPVAASPMVEHTARQLAGRLRNDTNALRVVPIAMRLGAGAAGLVSAVAMHSGRPVWRLDGPATAAALSVAIPLCWLEGCDLLVAAPGPGKLADAVAASIGVPLNLFVETVDRAVLEGMPHRNQLAPVELPVMAFSERVELWQSLLGPVVSDGAIAEIARRFRYEAEAIQEIATSLRNGPAPVTHAALRAACRAARPAELGELATRVIPRFDSVSQLFLPDRQREHFREVLQAMRSLTEVHYGWGTARVWNEGGIPVLFAGPPGTGKTMAAEILASELGLPMYRVDLSQVVSKYIGETEKNLKRIFDIADVSDTLLLFDEADSIFGKRMEARDAHDRYANLEISYLLERMERFKGMAVLATNRKKDLDEAFMRRLRYIVDFPIPGPEQRRQIWEQSIPAGVDASSLDLEMLSRQFTIAGGHIRSIVFNACLQSANGGSPRLAMEQVVVALKRELDKINRPVALDLFGPYAPIVRRMEREADHSG